MSNATIEHTTAPGQEFIELLTRTTGYWVYILLNGSSFFHRIEPRSKARRELIEEFRMRIVWHPELKVEYGLDRDAVIIFDVSGYECDRYNLP